MQIGIIKLLKTKLIRGVHSICVSDVCGKLEQFNSKLFSSISFLDSYPAAFGSNGGRCIGCTEHSTGYIPITHDVRWPHRGELALIKLNHS